MLFDDDVCMLFRSCLYVFDMVFVYCLSITCHVTHNAAYMVFFCFKYVVIRCLNVVYRLLICC